MHATQFGSQTGASGSMWHKSMQWSAAAERPIRRYVLHNHAANYASICSQPCTNALHASAVTYKMTAFELAQLVMTCMMCIALGWSEVCKIPNTCLHKHQLSLRDRLFLLANYGWQHKHCSHCIMTACRRSLTRLCAFTGLCHLQLLTQQRSSCTFALQR